MHAQHRALGCEAPEGQCCVCVVSHTKRAMTAIYHPLP